MWENKRVHVITDNVCAMYNVNNGTSVNLTSLTLLRQLCDLSLKLNFTITASLVRSHDNCIADSLSGLHSNGQLQRFLDAVSEIYRPQCFILNQHMSVKSLFFLSLQIEKWKHSLVSWTWKSTNYAH